MHYAVTVNILPHAALLDPQGKATRTGLHNLGYTQVGDVRIGKHIVLTVEADSESAARNLAEETAKALLCNPVMEQFSIADVQVLA